MHMLLLVSALLFTTYHQCNGEPSSQLSMENQTYWYTCSDVTIVPALNMCDSLCMETAQSYAFTVANAVIAGGPISVSSVYFESITIDSKDHPDYLLLASSASVNRCEDPVQTEVFIDTETDKMIEILKPYAAQEQPAMYCRDPATNFSALVQINTIISNFSNLGSVNIVGNINASEQGMSRGSSGTNPAIEPTINGFLQVEPGTLQVFQATFIGNTYLSPESRISYNASLGLPPYFVIGELNCVPSVVGSIVVAKVQYTLSNLGSCAEIAANFDLYTKIFINSTIISMAALNPSYVFPRKAVTLSDYVCTELIDAETVQTITFEDYCNVVGVTDCTDNGAAALAVAAANINGLGAQIIKNSVSTNLESIFSEVYSFGKYVTYGVLSATAEPTAEEPTAEPSDEPTEEPFSAGYVHNGNTNNYPSAPATTPVAVPTPAPYSSDSMSGSSPTATLPVPCSIAFDVILKEVSEEPMDDAHKAVLARAMAMGLGLQPGTIGFILKEKKSLLQIITLRLRGILTLKAADVPVALSCYDYGHSLVGMMGANSYGVWVAAKYRAMIDSGAAGFREDYGYGDDTEMEIVDIQGTNTDAPSVAPTILSVSTSSSTSSSFSDNTVTYTVVGGICGLFAVIGIVAAVISFTAKKDIAVNTNPGEKISVIF